MRIPFYTILLVLTFCIAKGQDTIKYDKIVFKVAPANFIDNLSFRTAQLGFEWRWAHRYSLDLSYGQVFGREPYYHQKGDGFKAKAEIRRYNGIKRTRKQTTYIALEGFFNKIDYNTTGEFEDSAHYSTYSENYFVKKNVWGLNLKYGVSFHILKRFVFDAFAGVGFRVKDLQQIGRSRPEDLHYSKEPQVAEIRDQAGDRVYVNPVLGFKIGYVLLK